MAKTVNCRDVGVDFDFVAIGPRSPFRGRPLSHGRRRLGIRLGFRHFAFGTVLAFGLVGCHGGTGVEPTEAQMKDAMEYAMNHPPGETVTDPVKITFFKKEACDNPTPQGYRCTLTVKVVSRNIGAGMYNNIEFGEFYKDKNSGKWMMRPPF